MPRKSAPTRRRQGRSSCAALILIDASPRRKKERTLYRRRTTELERETERLKAFEEQDVPSFIRWMDGEFGASLRVVHETTAVIHDLEELIDDVRAYAAMSRQPQWLAYRAVVEARDAGALEELFRRFDPREPGGAHHGDFLDDGMDELLRELAGLASEVLGGDFRFDRGDGDGQPDERARRGDAWSGHATAQRTTAAERDTDAYLKNLYRQLVRVLHPDSGQEMTSERQRLWLEVQDAYSWGDVHRLARLHASVCEGRAGGAGLLDLDAMPVGDIIALRRTTEQRLRQVRAQLKTARLEPAWGFWALLQRGGRALARIRRAIELELHDDLASTQAERERLDRIVAGWKRGPKDRPPRPHARRSRHP